MIRNKHLLKLRFKRRRRSRPRRVFVSPGSRFRHQFRRGLTAIEYCFILSIVLLVLLLVVQHFGNTLKASFGYSDTKLEAVGVSTN